MASVCINGTGSQGTFQLRVAAVTVSVETMNHRRSTWDALWQHLTCVTDVSCDTAVAMEDLKEACNTKPNYMYLGDFRFRGKGQQREAMKSSLPKSNKRPLENHGIKEGLTQMKLMNKMSVVLNKSIHLVLFKFHTLIYDSEIELDPLNTEDGDDSSSRMKCDKQSDTKGAQPSYGSANSLPCLPSTPMENTIIPLHCDSLTLQNPSFDDGLTIFTSKYGYLTDEERSEKPSLLPQARVGQTGSSAYGQEAPGQHQEEPSVCGPLFKRLTDGDSGKLLLLQHEADEYGLNIKTKLGKSVPECRMISFSVIHMARGIPTAAQIISKELIQKRSYQANAINTNPKRQQEYESHSDFNNSEDIPDLNMDEPPLMFCILRKADILIPQLFYKGARLAFSSSHSRKREEDASQISFCYSNQSQKGCIDFRALGSCSSFVSISSKKSSLINLSSRKMCDQLRARPLKRKDELGLAKVRVSGQNSSGA
ncbi:hypothetical protein MJT46_016053 [Ovis ammon polii x Ovis aries]|nr:hypothetical protein MJT46_016053 [Ovis ammon polii x Ovis aries]